MTETLTETAGTGDMAKLRGKLDTAVTQLEDLQESYAQLQLSREDANWMPLTQQAEQGLDRDHLVTQSKLHRVFATANALIKRGLSLRAAYVFGQGVGTTAEGKDANRVVQSFLDDPKAREVLFGAQAQEDLENLLGTDGNVFICMVTDRMTGQVTPRLIPFEEITEIISAPGDRATVWYYRREWSEFDPETGRTVQRKAYYPQLRYSPVTKQRYIGSNDERYPVMRDMPVYHVKVNAQAFQKWGIGDTYAAIPWARMYKEFLEDWATLMKSLSKVAWSHTRLNYSRGSQQQRVDALQKMGDMTPGSSVSMAPGDRIEAVPKSGATIDSESARPLATMVAAALGLPVTTLMSDPGQTGARAVAETLSFPTRLGFEARQEVWRETRRQLLEYVLLQAVAAPRGPLRGRVVRDGDSLQAELPNKADATLTIVFPPLDETPVETIMEALVKADSTGKAPPLVIAREILRALRVRDVDEELEKLTDEDGNFVPPQTTVADAAGQRAADALRRGGNPSDYL